MYDAAYFVPTHRLIDSAALDQQLLEADHARRAHGIRLPLVILDDGDGNGDALATKARRFPQLDTYYLRKPDIQALYAAVSEHLEPAPRRAFGKVFPDGRVNYGNVFNKIFVVAQLLGVRRIHRRDSDTYAQTLPHGGGRALFPIDLEIDWLGRESPCGKVLLVGGGYTGKWSIDIDHLIDDPDQRHVRRFFDTLSIAPEDHDIVLHEHIHGNNAPYQGDVIEPCSVKEPDCGNLALADIFDYIPCSPVAYALGGDYFTHASVIECGLGRVYHNRATVHAYSPCRYDQPEKLFGYWRNTACLVMYQHFHRRYWQRVKAEASRTLTPSSSLLETRDVVLSTLRAFRDEYRAGASSLPELLHDFYELIDRKQEPAVTAALQRVRAEEASLRELVERSIDDQADLLTAWHSISQAARASGSTSAVRGTLAKCRV